MKPNEPNEPNEELNLETLVSAANQQIERAADLHQRQQHAARGAIRAAPWGKIMLLVGVLVLVLLQGLELRRQFFGITQSALRLEAQSVLTAAHAAVEQHRKETGELPDRVPLAALDALVTMERSGSDYQLKLVLDDKTWTMDKYETITGIER